MRHASGATDKDGIAIFDLDRTLTRVPTYSLFLLTSARQLSSPLRLLWLPLVGVVAALHYLGALDRKTLKVAMHRAALGWLVPRQKAAELAQRFARRIVDDQLYDSALERIADERTAGRRIIIATAASEIYVAPLAKLLGVEDVVATRNVWHDDHFSCEIDGDNCHGKAKLARIRDHLAALGLNRKAHHIRFYSDDASDLPALEWADEAIAVNPCRKLRRIAIRKRWTILDWRGSDAAPSPEQGVAACA